MRNLKLCIYEGYLLYGTIRTDSFLGFRGRADCDVSRALDIWGQIMREFWIVETESTREIFDSEFEAKVEERFLRDELKAISIEVIHVQEVEL